MAVRSGSYHAREQLLQRRVLPIDTYASELQRGTHATLTRNDRVRLYGSSVVPVHVPLDPGESEAQHERRFIIWLSRRRLTLDDLHANANDERSFRILFAKIKTKMYVQRYGRSGGGAYHAKRGREEYEASADDDNDDDEEEAYDDEEDNESYDDDHDDEEEEEEDDDRDGDDSSSGSGRRYVSETTSILLHTRVLTAAEYRAEVEHDALHKPSLRDRLTRYGTAVAPIPVPLFPGESPHEYERKIVSFLASRRLTLAKLASNPGKERSIRMNFARKRIGGHFRTPQQIAALAKRASTAVARRRTSDPTDASILRRVGPAPLQSDSAETTAAEPTQPTTDAVDGFPTLCSLRPPPVGTDETRIPKAYLACGCRKCLFRCTSRLVRQVAELQHELAEVSASSASMQHDGSDHPVMDLTRDNDTPASFVPPSPAAATTTTQVRGVDVAKMLQLTALIKSRRQAHATTSSSSSSSRVARASETLDDPIEQQLRAAYDELNERVIANERVLEDEALALETMPLTPNDQRLLREATRTQDENQELRACIDDEKDARDGALAVLLVYTWRHALPELEQKLTHPSASDVAHVTRACHHKCASLASTLSRHQAEAVALKQQLDAVLSDVSSVSDEQRLAELQRLGEQLTQAQAAMRGRPTWHGNGSL